MDAYVALKRIKYYCQSLPFLFVMVVARGSDCMALLRSSVSPESSVFPLQSVEWWHGSVSIPQDSEEVPFFFWPSSLQNFTFFFHYWPPSHLCVLMEELMTFSHGLCINWRCCLEPVIYQILTSSCLITSAGSHPPGYLFSMQVCCTSQLQGKCIYCSFSLQQFHLGGSKGRLCRVPAQSFRFCSERSTYHYALRDGCHWPVQVIIGWPWLLSYAYLKSLSRSEWPFLWRGSLFLCQLPHRAPFAHPGGSASQSCLLYMWETATVSPESADKSSTTFLRSAQSFQFIVFPWSLPG